MIPVLQWGNWDSKSQVNVSRPNRWGVKPGFEHRFFWFLGARLPPCLPKPRVRRKTREMSMLPHLLYYLKKFRRPSHPWSLMVGGDSSPHCGSWELTVKGGSGCLAAMGPQCHFGNRLLTEDAHGRSFLQGCLGALCTFRLKSFPELLNSTWHHHWGGTPACQLLWQIWHLTHMIRASYLFTYRHDFPYNRFSTKSLVLK